MIGEFLLACKTFGFEVVGVDRAMPRIEEAHTKVLSSLDALDKNQKFHAITLFHVLEHLDDSAAILRRVAALMYQGGLLVLETPDCTGISGIRSRQTIWISTRLSTYQCFYSQNSMLYC